MHCIIKYYKLFLYQIVHTIINYNNRGDNYMKSTYCEKQLRNIAEECQEFEHIINAMGYGYSLLNVSTDDFVQRCSDCVNWLGGDCSIFQREMNS
jgi:hypothetical protein